MKNVKDNYAEFLKLLLDPKRLAAVMEDNNTKQKDEVAVSEAGCEENLREDDSSDSGFRMGM